MRATSRGEWVIAFLLTLILTVLSAGLVIVTNQPEPVSAPVVVESVPEWAEPSQDDERWQDPSGFPYCDASSPLYPCLDLDAMGYFDLWGDEAIIIADHVKGEDWSGIGLWNCDPIGSDCWLLEPSVYPNLYDENPNALVETTTYEEV